MTDVTRREIDTLKEQVMVTLERYPEARNSDKILASYLYRVFYSEHVVVVSERHYFNILRLPPMESVKRLRAVIQNTEKLFPPTHKDIAIKRGWLETEWKDALGYTVYNAQGQGEFFNASM